MKKVLITGKNSYVGNSFEAWLENYPGLYTVDKLSLKGKSWLDHDFSRYDVVFHVAAVVHQKEKKEMEEMYCKINRDLPLKVAKKAKLAGVKQFIFMSSISIYGISGKMNKVMVITKDTRCTPKTLYGKSKLEAENKLRSLSDEKFKIAMVRAPMIYGPNCPGNFKRLEKLIMSVPIFPYVKNQRSMIFIDNLSEFLKLLMDNQDKGLFFPQNKEFVNTSELVQLIASVNSKKIINSKFFASLLKPFGNNFSILNKLFGSLVIDPELSNYEDFRYCVFDLKQTIKKQ